MELGKIGDVMNMKARNVNGCLHSLGEFSSFSSQSIFKNKENKRKVYLFLWHKLLTWNKISRDAFKQMEDREKNNARNKQYDQERQTKSKPYTYLERKE